MNKFNSPSSLNIRFNVIIYYCNNDWGVLGYEFIIKRNQVCFHVIVSNIGVKTMENIW